MSEAVTVPTLMKVTSTVSEESFARGTHTDTDTVSVLFFKVCFANKN